MGKNSDIQWTDHTFNPWWGCWKVSPGCTNCYAWMFDKRLGGDHWHKNGERRFFGFKHWQEPLKWDWDAESRSERQSVFCASMADIFEDHPGLIGERQRLFGTIDVTPHLDWLLLTKRPENIHRMWSISGTGKDPGATDYARRENVWLMTTVENQALADHRINELLKCRHLSPVLGLSVEPMLEPIDLKLREWQQDAPDQSPDCMLTTAGQGIDWVICGGESGPKARPFDLAWARDLRDQCKTAGVPFFMKQISNHPHDSAEPGRKFVIKDSHGGDWDEWPEDLRVREFPRTKVASGSELQPD